MGIREKIKDLSIIKNTILSKKYGSNIHDIDINENIETGVVEKLMQARELGIDYCVVFGRMQPMNKSWDKLGNGEWNPPRDYITTNDIKTESNNRDVELENIYRFLRGENPVREESFKK